VVLADMEAGLEHLSWAGGTLRHVDLLPVVVQPTAKTLLTADRTVRLARQLGIPRVALVANRAGPRDLATLNDFAEEQGCPLLAVIPEDGAVEAADRAARCVLDTAPESASAMAIGRLADALDAAGR
jgi:CO dehydrogenase maturation factor